MSIRIQKKLSSYNSLDSKKIKFQFKRDLDYISFVDEIGTKCFYMILKFWKLHLLGCLKNERQLDSRFIIHIPGGLYFRRENKSTINWGLKIPFYIIRSYNKFLFPDNSFYSLKLKQKRVKKEQFFPLFTRKLVKQLRICFMNLRKTKNIKFDFTITCATIDKKFDPHIKIKFFVKNKQLMGYKVVEALRKTLNQKEEHIEDYVSLLTDSTSD